MNVYCPSAIDFRLKGTDKLIAECEKRKVHLTLTDWGDDAHHMKGMTIPFTKDKTILREFMLNTDVIADQFIIGSMGCNARDALYLNKPLLMHLDTSVMERAYDSAPPHAELHDSNWLVTGGRAWYDTHLTRANGVRAWQEALTAYERPVFLGDLANLNKRITGGLSKAKTLSTTSEILNNWRTVLRADVLVCSGTTVKYARALRKPFIVHALGSDIREGGVPKGAAAYYTAAEDLAYKHSEFQFIPHWSQYEKEEDTG